MEFVDMHEDIAFSSMREDIIDKSGQSSINKLLTFDRATVFSVIFPHIVSLNEKPSILSEKYGFKQEATYPKFGIMMDQFKFYHFLERNYNVRIIKNFDDIKSGLNFLISMEGTDVLDQPDDLYILKDLGLRALGLTWNYDTKFAASCMSKKDYGLTGFGEELIDIADKNHIIIDTAHASKKTIIEACSVSKNPIINSHSNVSKLKNHIRNLDDEEIKSIVDTDGIIGITAITTTLEKQDISAIIDNINYLGDNYGWRHVGIGTDFLGINSVPQGFENIEKLEYLKGNLGHYGDVFYKNAYRIMKKVL